MIFQPYLKFVEDRQVAVSCGRQHEGVAEPDDPVLGAVDVHLGRGTEDGDGRDEAAGDGHGGGEEGHLLGGQQVLRGRVLAPPGKEDPDEGGDHQSGREDQVLLPAELYRRKVNHRELQNCIQIFTFMEL